MKNANKKYKRYPEYKLSGVEWLGEVPSDWRVQKLKYFASIMPSNIDKKTRDGEKRILLCNYTDVYYNEVISTDIQFMTATAKNEQINKFALKKGDVLITKDSEDPNDIAVSAYVIEDLQDVLCGYHLAIIRPFNSNAGNFLYYLFKSIYARSTATVKANGLTRYALGTYPIKNIVSPLPPTRQQVVIAAFLDRETGKIDRMVERQGRMIELLQEKRQAVISRAVTKGLDPDAPMKDSGVEWLGEIPEGWEVRKMKYICRVQTGGKDTVDAVEDGKYPFFVRSQNVERINTHTFNCEAVLTAGDGAGVGKVFHHYKGPFDFHQRVYMMNRFKKIYGRYFFFYLREQFAKVALDGNAKSTVDSLRMPLLMDFPFTIPPLSEQEAIILFIDKQITKIDSLISKAKAAIELMKERRTALISAAVTGKIDVRDAIEYELGDTGGLMAAEGGGRYAADS